MTTVDADDRFGLQRFVDAQDAGGQYERAVDEIGRGRKRGHWMWFVFPQLVGLGRSEMAQRYGISGLAEARAYLEHPVLGPRLRRCAALVVALGESDPVAVLGGTDATKLRSSMTLFAVAAPNEPVFREVLDRYYSGETDPLTVQRLGVPWTS